MPNDKSPIIAINDLPFMTWIIDSTSMEVKFANGNAKAFSLDPYAPLKESEKTQLTDLLKGPNDGKSISLECLSNVGPSWIMFQTHLCTSSGDILLCGTDISVFKDREYQLGQILDVIPDMILVKGKGSKIIWANDSFRKHYGMSNEDLKKITLDAKFNEPDYTQQYVIDDAWVWKNQKPLVIECEPVTRFDGVVRKFQTLKAPLFNKDGKIEVTVGISRDITESVEKEERSYASSKMAALGEMAGGISHEINNPLTVILGRTRQLHRKLSAESRTADDEVFDYLKSIEDHSYRIVKIVEGLKRFCHEGTNEPFVMKKISGMVDQILTFCSSRLESLGIETKINIPPDLEAEVKEVPLSHVLLNLLNNAIDAVEGLEHPWIKIEARTKNGRLEILVSDSGPGVPDEIATKVMQPFFTTKAINKGTGLGLSISQTIVKHHGGSLKLDRSVSNSCFILSFPIKQKS